MVKEWYQDFFNLCKVNDDGEDSDDKDDDDEGDVDGDANDNDVY